MPPLGSLGSLGPPSSPIPRPPPFAPSPHANKLELIGL